MDSERAKQIEMEYAERSSGLAKDFERLKKTLTG